jgi:RNA polymerase sigma-70 factor (ECF subfamily)
LHTGRGFAWIRPESLDIGDPINRARRIRGMHGAIARDETTSAGSQAGRLVAGDPTPTMTRSSDDLILLVAREQDRAAFSALFESFAPRLKGYLVRQGARPAEAEELVQEAMVAVWRKAALFDPSRASAATWIFRIARNLRIDAARRDRHADAYQPDLSEAPDPPSTPEGLAAARQQDARVHVALAGLPADQREVLRMSFFHDRPHAEIAQELRLPLGTVKSRIRLALQRLRASLDGEA